MPMDIHAPFLHLMLNHGTRDEAEWCQVFQFALSNLSRSVWQVKDALELFDALMGATEDKGIQIQNTPSRASLRTSHFRRLAMLPVQQAAISISGAQGIILALNQAKGQTNLPLFADNIDHGRARNALRRFNRSFPNIKLVRHSLAHPEVPSTPAEMKTHLLKEDLVTSDEIRIGRGSSYTGVKGGTFITTWKGRAVSIELSQQTYDELLAIVTDYFIAFDQLSLAVQRRSRTTTKSGLA